MRGFPPVQIFLLGLIFGLLAIPLVRLTTDYDEMATRHDHEMRGQASDSPGTHATDQSKKVSTYIRLRFAHLPLTISLKQGDQELAGKLDLSASPVEFQSALPLSPDGNELIVTATWPDGTPNTALTVELEPDGLESRSETVWSTDATLNEVLTFLW